MVLIDAGPLIALIHKDDRHHERCVEALRSVSEPLGTVWPAFTEAMYLLSFSWRAQEALWEMLERGVIVLLALELQEVSRMRELMKKYKDLPMDLADAALVAVAERERIRQIFTLDRRDFEVYRPARLGRFILLPQ
ncbi:pilus biogenesis protein [Nitrospira sp. KM1]|uniref:type II toxin-antitoxin system VapC family toxin n=1 Tax=Nitrospira sp. KM1 TaxID=1936990 RepID=UPI0013A74D13|nr:PIN domain-containing protein [Nitrospira sp. KM1]BCA56428.1 pilus biogenesis protein [Nitrospira sp. KM1]